ncbi:Uncharacterised protein [Vibrio cholerae]|nr:Uncharacterised protein [Vibrio cholerae]
MHIHLWEWNFDTVGIQRFFDRLHRIKVHCPIVRSFTPWTNHKVD